MYKDASFINLLFVHFGLFTLSRLRFFCPLLAQFFHKKMDSFRSFYLFLRTKGVSLWCNIFHKFIFYL